MSVATAIMRSMFSWAASIILTADAAACAFMRSILAATASWISELLAAMKAVASIASIQNSPHLHRQVELSALGEFRLRRLDFLLGPGDRGLRGERRHSGRKVRRRVQEGIAQRRAF